MASFDLWTSKEVRFTHVEMSGQPEQKDSLGIGGVGGFVDTVGRSSRKRRGRSEDSEDAHPSSLSATVSRDVLKDVVEERLEEILFGKKPFYSIAPDTLDTDSEAEEDVSVCVWEGGITLNLAALHSQQDHAVSEVSVPLDYLKRGCGESDSAMTGKKDRSCVGAEAGCNDNYVHKTSIIKMPL